MIKSEYELAVIIIASVILISYGTVCILTLISTIRGEKKMKKIKAEEYIHYDKFIGDMEHECESCEYVNKSEEEEPCKRCSHNYANMWMPRKPTALDKIRAEIEALSNANPSYWYTGDMVEREEVLDIIDKYRGDENDNA